MPVSIFAQYRFGGIGGIDMGGGISYGGVGGIRLTPRWDEDSTYSRDSNNQIEESQVEANAIELQKVEQQLYVEPSAQTISESDNHILVGILILSIAFMGSLILIMTYESVWKTGKN